MKTPLFKQILLFSAFVFFACGSYAQSSETNTGFLQYKPEIPDTSTYKIVKNTTGAPLPTSILEKINLYRRFDVDYLWVVNNEIEILVYVYHVNKSLAEPRNINGNGK